MPISPQADADAEVTCRVLLAGTALADTAQVLSIEVQRAVGALPSARVVLADGDVTDGRWPLADGNSCLPGTEIEIQAGHGAELATLFKGVVVCLDVRIGADNGSSLALECRDKAVVLTLQRRHAVYADQTDTAVLKALITQAGLAAEVEAIGFSHPQLVQFDATDWDFLRARARANGLLVVVEDGTVHARAAPLHAKPALQVRWGEDLISFDARLDAREQPAAVHTAAWWPATQAMQPGPSARPQPGPAMRGNLAAQQIAAMLGGPVRQRVQAGAAAHDDALKAWAQAEQARAALSRLHGTVRFAGSALARVGGLLALAGVGDRFAGEHLIGRLQHHIADGEWVTEVGLGLDPQEPPAPDHAAPPVAPHGTTAGLQIGVVCGTGGDPDGEQRIAVQLPVFAGAGGPLWARLLQPLASDGFGACFVPEVGDEVLVGFFEHDPGSPVVLGSLYSSRHQPPHAMEEARRIRALVTRAGHRIAFDDDARTITLSTPGRNEVVLDDAASALVLQDAHGNRVQLDAQGIRLDSSRDIVLHAQGQVSVTAAGHVAVTSHAGDVTTTALNIACQAQLGFSATGGATAQLSAAGQTTLRGALVLIN